MKTNLLLLCLNILFVTACASSPFSLSRVAAPVQAQLDQPFTLGLGQAAHLSSEDLTITFLEMRADSRCPSEVNCAERGQAVVFIQAQRGDLPSSTFELNDNPPLKADTASYENYHLQFVDLSPYPKRPDESIPLRDYSVTLLVSPF